MRYAKWLTRMTVLSMVLTIAGTAVAGSGMERGGRHGKNRGPMGFHFLKRLDLTQEQRAQVRDIISAHREEMRSHADALAAARETLMETMEAESLDESAVREAHRALAGVKEEMAVLRARMFHEIKGILTPEQNARLVQMRAEKRERMKARREHRRARIDDRLPAGPDPDDDWDAE